jgi:hypothetical protein
LRAALVPAVALAEVILRKVIFRRRAQGSQLQLTVGFPRRSGLANREIENRGDKNVFVEMLSVKVANDCEKNMPSVFVVRH